MMMLFEIATTISILFAIFAVAAMPVLVGAWIVLPLDKAAKRFKRPTRFSILDFFGLVFLVQMPMALVHGLVPRDQEGVYWTLMAVGWVVSLALWAAAVKTFSNAGIADVWTRALLVFFVLPMAYFAPSAILIMAVYTANATNHSKTPILVAVSCALFVGIGIAGLLSRRVAKPLLSRINNPFAEVPSDDPDAEGALPVEFSSSAYEFDERLRNDQVAGLFADHASSDIAANEDSASGH